MPVPTPSERIGTTLAGRYRLERPLASGGMGLLFAGVDTRTFKPVAIKLLRPNDHFDPVRVQRFLQEMHTTAQLRHPHVVDVLDLGEDECGAPYLVMELLRGRSLEEELSQCGRLTLEQTLALGLPILAALDRVHSAGVLHRDIKPQNIFLCDAGAGTGAQPKLLDFGIAKVSHSSIETAAGAVVGTPAYMSPEQARGKPLTAASDLYSLGAVLYRCLSGEPPFPGDDATAILAQLVTQPAPQLEVADVAPTLLATVDRSLYCDPSMRYATARDFSRALRTAARSAGVTVPREYQFATPPTYGDTSAALVPTTTTAVPPTTTAAAVDRKPPIPWVRWLTACAGVGILGAVLTPEAPTAQGRNLPAAWPPARNAPTHVIRRTAVPATDAAPQWTPGSVEMSHSTPLPAPMAETDTKPSRQPARRRRTPVRKRTTPTPASNNELPIATEW